MPTPRHVHIGNLMLGNDRAARANRWALSATRRDLIDQLAFASAF
jgi:hypothetical protein